MNRSEFYTVIGGVLCILGFTVMIWVNAFSQVRERILNLEIETTSMKCVINPEICREILRPDIDDH